MSSLMRKPTLMEFVNYEIVHRNGKFNMITEMEKAAKDAGLTLDQYKNVIGNYQWCISQWNNCLFKIVESWNEYSGLGHKDVTDDNGNVIKYEIDYGIDDLNRIRSEYPNHNWELEQILES